MKRGRLVGDEGMSKPFEVVAREWHALELGRWKPVRANDVITSLERDTFPDLGSMPLVDIDKPLLLAVLRKAENRGAIETARRPKQRVAAVYRYANAEGAKLENTVTEINNAPRPLPPPHRYPALLFVEAIRGLMADIDRAGASPVNRLAARILALKAQRSGMVRFTQWNDITGNVWADPEAESSDALWKVPAQKIRLDLHLRSDKAFSKGRHVPHRWRSSFSTIMNEKAERELGNDVRLLPDRMITDLMRAYTPEGTSASKLRYNRRLHASPPRTRSAIA